MALELNDANDTPEGTEGVETQTDDTEDDYSGLVDFDDPEEDTEEEQADSTDDGESEAQAEAEPEQKQEEEPAEVQELRKGYMRQEDYTRKTTEVAQLRKSTEADLARIEGITQAFVDHLSKMIPAAPDMALLARDQKAYLLAQAAHHQAVEQVKKLVEMGEQVKAVRTDFDAKDREARVKVENQRLIEKFPEAATVAGRTKFMTDAADAAQAVGFTMEDLQGVEDHRMFALAHWAKIGMNASKAKPKAVEKVTKAPPRRAAPQTQSRKALERLTRSGSMRDAMRVDFE